MAALRAPDGRVVHVDQPVLVIRLKAQGYVEVTTPPAPPAPFVPVEDPDED